MSILYSRVPLFSRSFPMQWLELTALIEGCPPIVQWQSCTLQNFPQYSSKYLTCSFICLTLDMHTQYILIYACLKASSDLRTSFFIALSIHNDFTSCRIWTLGFFLFLLLSPSLLFLLYINSHLKNPHLCCKEREVPGTITVFLGLLN